MQVCHTSALPLAKGLSMILNLYRGVLNILLTELRPLHVSRAASSIRWMAPSLGWSLHCSHALRAQQSSTRSAWQ